MDTNEIRTALLKEISDATSGGYGFRTTDVERLVHRLGLDSYDRLFADEIRALVAEGRIKAVTEKFRQDRTGRWTGDYCWLVPSTYSGAPRHGYIHVEKIQTHIFDLTGRPDNGEIGEKIEIEASPITLQLQLQRPG